MKLLFWLIVWRYIHRCCCKLSNCTWFSTWLGVEMSLRLFIWHCLQCSSGLNRRNRLEAIILNWNFVAGWMMEIIFGIGWVFYCLILLCFIAITCEILIIHIAICRLIGGGAIILIYLLRWWRSLHTEIQRRTIAII